MSVTVTFEYDIGDLVLYETETTLGKGRVTAAVLDKNGEHRFGCAFLDDRGNPWGADNFHVNQLKPWTEETPA